MDVKKIPQEYRDRFLEIMTSDSVNVHFLWCPDDKKVITAGRELFPADVEDPFDFLGENDCIADESMALYSVFCSQIQENLIKRADKQYASVDVKMRLNPDEEYALHRINVAFMCDHEGSRGIDILANIRRYSERETFDRAVVNMFSSDKHPAFFQSLIHDMIERNAGKKYSRSFNLMSSASSSSTKTTARKRATSC